MFADIALRLECYRKFKMKRDISTSTWQLLYCYIIIRSDAAELVEIESRDPQRIANASFSIDTLTEQLFTCKLGGRTHPPTRANRPPTPGLSPKWVNRLFFVILWPVERVVTICLNTV